MTGHSSAGYRAECWGRDEGNTESWKLIRAVHELMLHTGSGICPSLTIRSWSGCRDLGLGWNIRSNRNKVAMGGCG